MKSFALVIDLILALYIYESHGIWGALLFVVVSMIVGVLFDMFIEYRRGPYGLGRRETRWWKQ